MTYDDPTKNKKVKIYERKTSVKLTKRTMVCASLLKWKARRDVIRFSS